MRTKALALRIINQIRHDKRTAALIIIAPLIILTIIYFILDSGDTTYKIGVVKAPSSFTQALKDNSDYDVAVSRISASRAEEAVKSEEVLASVTINDDDMSDIKVDIDGTDSAKAQKVQAIILNAAAASVQEDMEDSVRSVKDQLKDLEDHAAYLPSGISLPDADMLVTPEDPGIDADYIYGSKDGSMFDNYGAPLVGIIIFFLVFLIAGINFLGERTSGTLEKLLSTPIKRSEIITGYVLGFSLLALLQSIIVSCFIIYVLGMSIQGSIWFVLLINLLTAICALTMGMLLSTLANSEFQMVQFIPLVILPQIFLCGLFELSGGWKAAGYFMPLHYTTDALTEVMLRGSGISAIWTDLLVLLGLCLLFMAGNAALLKKQRAV